MKNIAVLGAGMSARTTLEVTSGIRDCVIAHDCNVFFFTSEKHYDANKPHDLGEYNIYRLPKFELFDGVIILNSSITSKEVLEEVVEKIIDSKVPAVSTEYYRPEMYNVMIDNKAAMRELVEHFVVEHGFRRIDFIRGPEGNREAEERFEAYREVLFERGIPFEEKRVFVGNYLEDAGKAAVEYFLSIEDELPDAIISSNDVMALSAMVALEKKGILVPENIAVSGFDDENAAKYNEPRLTTVAREQYRTGFSAAERLLGGFTDEDRGMTQILKTQFKRRESCGCSCREVIDNIKFRKNHFLQEDTNEQHIKEAREMAVDLTMVDSLSELKGVLDNYVPQLGCDYFLMVLNKEWEGRTGSVKNPFKSEVAEDESDYLKLGYSDSCELVYGYSETVPIEELKLTLPTLMDWLNERNKGRNYFTVLPLHYRDRCFGYCIIGNSEFAFNNTMLPTWTMALSNSLESIRRQHILRGMIKKLDSMWIYDNLTGLYNRSGFNKYGAYIWQECIENKSSALIMFADLDGLKYVNDTYGHDAGDRFIKAVATILKRHKKHGEIIMRYGGDEFVILAPNINKEDAETYRERLLDEFDTYNMTHTLPYKIDASVGINIVYPKSPSELEIAIEEADARMYEAKREKKGERK